MPGRQWTQHRSVGALRDGRSCLFAHVPRIRDLLKKFFAWCPVYTLMESVASMDASDRDIMSGAVGMNPLSCNAGTLTWCQRPRLYWVDCEIDAEFVEPSGDSSPDRVILQGQQAISQVTRAGWLKVEPRQPFPTFTTSRPQERPGRKPAGIKSCTAEEISRWQADLHRFPPYQYKVEHCLVNRANQLRVPDVSERELMMGFPSTTPHHALLKDNVKVKPTTIFVSHYWGIHGAYRLSPGCSANFSGDWGSSCRSPPSRFLTSSLQVSII